MTGTAERRLRALEERGGGLFILSGPDGFDARAELTARGLNPRSSDLVVSVHKPAPAEVRLIAGRQGQ